MTKQLWKPNKATLPHLLHTIHLFFPCFLSCLSSFFTLHCFSVSYHHSVPVFSSVPFAFAILCLIFLSFPFLQAGGKHYHPSCARCARCHMMFLEGEEMYLTGNQDIVCGN